MTIKIIKPHSERTLVEDAADIWAHRELLMVLVRREISVRYRQAVIGLLWVVLQPLLTTAIFTTVFVVFVRIPTQEQSYPLFAFAGLAVWQYFNRVVTEGGGSLIANSALITKVSFPRLIIPLVSPIAAALDSLVAISALIVIAMLMGASVSWTIVFTPLVIAAVGLFGYAIALWLAPLNAVYRDVGIALPSIMQVAMYMSPIVYPATLVPERIRWLYELNPIAVMVNTMRWVVLGTNAPPIAGLGLFVALIVLLFWGGAQLFRRMEGNLIDRI
ncbi:ABC transporter permease [Bradyrhizobium vignae]|uniref:Transport permease protein n=1 Tax=Bradyrhizobium vignae TaxID=1549949 RepID=A0ABS3ZYQ8_9BRAD|nr:ABC transporter permease [Bradyrhizobium vignae]MBP0113290.1 ABC transporter permease [Bradyrhizobium vignae]